MALRDVRDRFFLKHPTARILDDALQGPDNRTPLFFMQSLDTDPDLKGAQIIIGRLGPDLERRFGVNGEVAIFMVPWRDFQRRSFNAITTRLLEIARTAQKAGERFTPSARLVIVMTVDQRIDEHLVEWQKDSDARTTVVPLFLSAEMSPEETRDKLVIQLRARLGDRDLYATKNPVVGADFFGRTTLMRTAQASLMGDSNMAILGLRRSGKTSVIRELKRMLLPVGGLVTIADFQMLDSSTVGQLATNVATTLNDDLRAAKQLDKTVYVGNEQEQSVTGLSLPGLADRIRRVASRNPQLRIILAVDEIEAAITISKTNPQDIKSLLGALRASASSCENVTLLFGGVANRLFTSSTLGSGELVVDNPVFGQVECVYLGPFGQDEVGLLLRGLGQPMFLNWTDEAVELVYRLTGGLPYFVRALASSVRRQILQEDATALNSVVTIAEDAVHRAAQAWSKSAGEDWLALQRSLSLHYPVAADLLDKDIDGATLSEWTSEDEEVSQAADDLIALGLLRRDGRSVARSQTLQAMHSLVGSRGPLPADKILGDQSGGILNLIRAGESQTLELKSSFRINLRTDQDDKRMPEEVLRAVAGFLNADGGTLLVGVTDEGSILGITTDLRVFAGDKDRFERWLRGDLLGKRIDSAIVSRCVRVNFQSVRGKEIVSLVVEPSSEPAWVDNEHYFVRNGNQTTTLKGRELSQHMRLRAQ